MTDISYLLGVIISMETKIKDGKISMLALQSRVESSVCLHEKYLS